ncbi:splicing factor Cactin [Parasteatoda tepidariorum]|nr:cactin [Parasteatoda tepidariorum]
MSQKDSSEKNLLKSLETPEEKRLRRFAKKELKERKRKEKVLGWDKEYINYTNTDNPFGDTNLLNTFVWKKKLEKEGLNKLDKEELERRNRQKLEQNKLELEKVKQRRLEREKEREFREAEMTRIQREKEAATFSEWEKQEDTFHLQQAKLRSKIRIQDGRAKPIDLLARYISSEEEDFTVEMHEPYVYLNGLKSQDLEDLQEDIKVYIELENGKNFDYWKDLQIIVDDEIHKLRELSGSEHRESINSSVNSEIVSIFKGKSPTQLQAMYRQIEKKIAERGEGLDISYWETLLSRLNAYMARARLRERHEENLRHKLYKLKQEQGVERTPLFPCVSNNRLSDDLKDNDAPSTSRVSNVSSNLSDTNTASNSSDTDAPSTSKDTNASSTSCDRNEPSTSSDTNDHVFKEPENKNTEVQNNEKSKITGKPVLESYESGRYSPVLIRYSKVEPGVILLDPVEDADRLEFMQKRLSKQGSASGMDLLSEEEKAFHKIAKKGMDSDEAVFSVEHNVDKAYTWSDKYRPRKPRYFNRVHTGFEWNKYNQTHYDMDNPPPKIVQGYKFNIFYPDLIDKTKTPEYSLSVCDDNKDFAILRFKAGPPYEDIAFKIVNKEWEYSYKRGFRCQFHNNIFQLYFHFKRYRYRR